MERSNQPPKTEDCLAEGQPVDLWFYRKERPSRSVSTGKREPQAGPASGLSNSASKESNASGEGVVMSESKTKSSVKGKDEEGLPGSKSVARAEGNTWNEGDPKSPCRTNCEGQAGREAQRQGAPPGIPGVGLAHSSQQQGASPEAGEGANRSTQSAQATSTVRTTEQDWQTFLRAIAEKAYTNKHHRFGDLYRWLNQDVLRLCFYRLRKDAASGVDGVTFQEYEKNLEANLAGPGRAAQTQGVSSAVGATQIHPQGQRETAPFGHSRAGGQAGASGGDANPAGDIRNGLSALQLRLPAGDERARRDQSPDARSCSLADTTSWSKRTSKGSLTTSGGNGWSGCWSKESLMEPY